MMGLTKKQEKVMDELFKGGDEQQVLENNKVSRGVYKRWLKEERWVEEFERRIEALNRQSRIMIATYKPFVAAKLLNLIDCKKEHTARQACEDIIRMEQETEKGKEISGPLQERGLPEISPETASELLGVLARRKNAEKDNG